MRILSVALFFALLTYFSHLAQAATTGSNGFITVTNPANGTPASPVPTQATLVGGKDGSGNLQPLSVDSTGNLNTNLPTGASTSALQTTGNTSLGSIDTKTPSLVSGRVPVDGSGVTQPVSGTVTSDIGLTNGLALDATLSAAQPRKLQDGSGNAITSRAEGSNRGLDEHILGSAATNHARNDYASTAATTSAYVQLLASTSSEAHEVEIFDSSGQTLVLAYGAAASEVDQILITPGGNGRIKLRVPAATRLSVKAVSADATAGEIDLNLYD